MAATIVAQPFFPYLLTGTSVLNDEIFLKYGGDSRDSNEGQREAAYQIAEQFAIQEIGTFLAPVTVTGTFMYPVMGDHTLLQLPHTHIRDVKGVVTIHEAGCNCAADGYEISGCAWLLNSRAGLVSLDSCGVQLSSGGSTCSCQGRSHTEPLLYRIAYEAGFDAGIIAANAPTLMGLVTAADLALEQIVDPAGAQGGPGDPSLTNASDTGYSQSMQYLVMTAFGGSPRANYAARMLKPLKYKRALRLS